VRFVTGIRYFLFSVASKPYLRFTKPPLQWVPRPLSTGLNPDPHLHLVSRSRMEELYLHSPIRLYTVVLNKFSTGTVYFLPSTALTARVHFSCITDVSIQNCIGHVYHKMAQCSIGALTFAAMDSEVVYIVLLSSPVVAWDRLQRRTFR
jgi:hypothetical protein